MRRDTRSRAFRLSGYSMLPSPYGEGSESGLPKSWRRPDRQRKGQPQANRPGSKRKNRNRQKNRTTPLSRPGRKLPRLDDEFFTGEETEAQNEEENERRRRDQRNHHRERAQRQPGKDKSDGDRLVFPRYLRNHAHLANKQYAPPKSFAPVVTQVWTNYAIKPTSLSPDDRLMEPAYPSFVSVGRRV